MVGVGVGVGVGSRGVRVRVLLSVLPRLVRVGVRVRVGDSKGAATEAGTSQAQGLPRLVRVGVMV